MLFQCQERESGGVQCEALVTYQGEPHNHWISQETIDNGGFRPTYLNYIEEFEEEDQEDPFEIHIRF